jgi:hypothetical protein
MAVPRPLLLALLGAFLLGATFLATRNAREASESASNPPAKQASAPKPAAQEKPQSKSQPESKPRADRAAKEEKATARSEAPRERAGARRKRARQATPAAVARAIARNRPIVLFLYQRGGEDDRPVARSVASLRGRTDAAVYADRVDNVARYGPVIAGVGVTRAPSIVIVGKDGRASLIEGYIDPDALAQEVADAR